MFYDALRSNKPEPSVDEMQAAFADSWHQQQEGEIPVLLNDDETPEGLAESANTLIAVFHEQAPRPYKIVGVDPFSSPVPLEALQQYKLAHSSTEQITWPTGKTVPKVKIFEYLK